MFGLDDRTVKMIRQFLQVEPEVLEARVYGSRAMGNYRPGSDIDLAIWTNSAHDISFHVKAMLEALPTPYMFDVTDYNRISHQPLKDHIDRVGKLFYRRT